MLANQKVPASKGYTFDSVLIRVKRYPDKKVPCDTGSEGTLVLFLADDLVKRVSLSTLRRRRRTDSLGRRREVVEPRCEQHDAAVGARSVEVVASIPLRRQ